jgi:hypothetical protein
VLFRSLINPKKLPLPDSIMKLIYKVVLLVHPPPKEWTDRLSGNALVWWKIYQKYRTVEKQQWRLDVMDRIMPFGCCLESGDPNWEEVIEWMLYEYILAYERGEVTFDSIQVDPENWYQDGRGYRISNLHENDEAARMTVKRLMDIERVRKEIEGK